MLFFCRLLNVTFLFLFLNPIGLSAQTAPTTLVAPANWQQQGILIQLRDELKHPKMNWPVTRLRYTIDFAGMGVSSTQLQLRNVATGAPVPFQLLDSRVQNGRLQKATLNFLMDLPSGSEKTIRLTSKNGPIKPVPLQNVAAVSVQKNGKTLVLSNGLVRAELPLPTSQSTAVPPILRLGNVNTWFGKGSLSVELKPTSLMVTEESNGSLMAEYKLAYEFSKTKRYTATIRLVAGMDFLELEEAMQGFNPQDSLAWQLVWDNLKPDFRYAPNRQGGTIDANQKGYSNFAWEPIGGGRIDTSARKHPMMPFDQQSQANGKLPFQITPYDNWLSWWNLHTAAFWSVSQNQSIGLFIKEIEKWNDGDYALWASHEKLSIQFLRHNDVLHWRFPLVAGTRSTGLAIYPHQKDVDLVNKTNTPFVHIDYLRRWYGWISLDKVKNWVLNYAEKDNKAPIFFTPTAEKVSTELAALEQIFDNQLNLMADHSERSTGPSPVGTRIYYDPIVPRWDAYRSNMTADQYRKLRATFLFMNQVFMDESLMPMRTILSGHPNFLADIKGVPGMTAAMFPAHPQAREMADHFEKAAALNLKYHVRPEVPDWQAKGGRWTENLGTYTWAFLKPTLRTSYLLHHTYDGRNRILQPNLSLYANWLLNGLTAPLESAGGKRVNPPQGAHAHGITPSSLMRTLGEEMAYYDPLTAEHIWWITAPDDKGFELRSGQVDHWSRIDQSPWKDNKGTNPHLRSAKYTGYGFTLRHGFDTKHETYVHLQQIDEGPNYRWGRAAQGGNGIIYYYADGKRYSHNGPEDVGDGPFGDVERCTNFGVKKPGGYRHLGPYRSVGPNNLTEPLADFGFAQFAQINANKEAMPDYRSRSVLQSGGDYILIFDEVKGTDTEGRFSWFVGKDDEFPVIQQLLPGALPVDAGIQSSKSNYHDDKDELLTKGRFYDGKGHFLTLVTHKSGIQAQKTAYGCVVTKENGTMDWVFRSASEQTVSQDGLTFRGTAGIIQHNADKSYTAALFRGTQVGVPGLTITFTENGKNAVSLQSNAGGFNGAIQVQEAANVTFTLTTLPVNSLSFYLDGKKIVAKITAKNTLTLTIPKGNHSWQWSSIGVIPDPTVITGTTHRSQGVDVSWMPVSGATTYRLELSKDGGTTWERTADNVPQTHTSLTALTDGIKLHIRVLAKGAGGWSIPSDDYPVYITNQVPHAPEGLLIQPNEKTVAIRWGQILGASHYTLYRQEKSVHATKVEAVYTGSERAFLDKVTQPSKIYTYWVTATNGNGVSEKSTTSDTDPARLINWYPKPNELFRRDTRSHENGYDEFNPFVESAKPILTYPNHHSAKTTNSSSPRATEKEHPKQAGSGQKSVDASLEFKSKSNQHSPTTPLPKNVSQLANPLDVIKLIGDKLIRDTPFTYRLVKAPINHTFNDLQFVDFGRTFGLDKSAVAYAYTSLNVANDQELALQVEHNDGCKIWLNSQLVYEKRGDHTIHLAHEERSVELPNRVKITLKKGRNDVLIKSETGGREWRVYLQPPSEKGAILEQTNQYPQIGLAEVTNVDSTINSLTNWLVIGPFENPVRNNQRTGLDIPYAPETERTFGVMYTGLGGPITWTIPKIDILGDLVDPQPWGTNYHWNYHNGGVAWGMQQLAETTHEKKYNDYAISFCDFQLKSIPFVRHQVHTLNAINSTNNHLIDTPLLDFTLAPSLPFIYRLRQQTTFPNRQEYVQFVDKMLNYARNEQIRLPSSGIYTRVTPETYTTWADDMFMGIPFLVQAALYAPTPAMKQAFLDDAANQIIGFNKEVWDSDASLYMHAHYSKRPVKLPHWSRANGWAAWAMSDVLMNLPQNHPQYAPILTHFQKHIASLAKLQDASGFWFNVLDRPDSQKEVSGTAIFTMAIARGVHNGWLDVKIYKPIAQRGWDALKTEIDPDGTVHRICMGTMCSEDVNYYINRPFYDNDTHGLFAVLFAGLAMHQMGQTASKF